MARFQPTQTVNASRYIIVPCEADGSSDLAVIWDRLEEQVVDVISAAASSRYSDAVSYTHLTLPTICSV